MTSTRRSSTRNPFKPARRSPMQVTIEAILKARGHLRNFNTPNGNHWHEFHLRIDNQPWMPFVIERHGQRVMIAHFFLQNGDVMYDPEIVFQLPAWEPVEITQHPVGLYRTKYIEENGRKLMLVAFDRQVMPLVNVWARNLRDQDFITGGLATSHTHPPLQLSTAAD